MSNQLPDGMMRTRGGVRIAARPVNDVAGPGVAAVILGIQVTLTTDESHQLRDILQAAELDAARGNVIT